MSSAVSRDMIMEQKLGRDRKRARDHKHKWAYGEDDASPGHPSRRPLKGWGWYRHPRPPGGVSNLAFSCRDSESSTTDEYFQRASTLPEPDAGISYSFDAPRGPQQGSQILKAALAKAVEKFEIKATEKLVKEEYEVIGKEKEESDASLDLEDDDYELV